ncbi:MAG: N-glycosylase [Acidobacteriota bacterium]
MTLLPIDFYNFRTMIETLHDSYREKRAAIRSRLDEFAALRLELDDRRIFEELVYCIFTAGASARMGLKSVERVRPHLLKGTHHRLTRVLLGAHRYPRARSGYIVHTRRYLEQECELKLWAQLARFGDDREGRRDFLAANPGIKGIGYKEASHFLRNVGFTGYAILDKHILRTLAEFEVIESSKPPTTKKKYLDIEGRMREFAERICINVDELDLLLWSNKTGEILK